ncbi:Nn.00g044990.m01.CDS01 [Neocucurbitaria sp. VM-36]
MIIILDGKALVKAPHIIAIHHRLSNEDEKGEEVTIAQIIDILDSGPEKTAAFHFERTHTSDSRSLMGLTQLKETSGFCRLVNDFDQHKGFWQWINSTPVPYVFVRQTKAEHDI